MFGIYTLDQCHKWSLLRLFCYKDIQLANTLQQLLLDKIYHYNANNKYVIGYYNMRNILFCPIGVDYLLMESEIATGKLTSKNMCVPNKGHPDSSRARA